jgi:hypothetical protein
MPQADTTRPPISPRRAFLYSLLVPGSAQSLLQRPHVGALFFGFEVAGIALATKAASDLRYARAHARDSIILRYEVDAITGLPVLDEDGNPIAQDDATRALRAAHAAFWLSPQTISVGVIGPGQVGRALLSQLAAAIPALRQRSGIDLRIRALADSRRMRLGGQGFDTAAELEVLQQGGGEPADLDAFKSRISGGVLGTGDAGYDEARKVWNGTVDRRPALIARCLTDADVQAGVRFAAEHRMLLSVKGGGHHIAGNAVAEGGLMLDMSGMKAIRIDAAERTARVGPGALLADFDREAQAHGLARPLGINSTTGVTWL